MEIVAYEPRHLGAVVALCKAEGWTTFAGNRERAGRAMTGAGVTALVAVERRGEDGSGVGGGAAGGGAGERGPGEGDGDAVESGPDDGGGAPVESGPGDGGGDAVERGPGGGGDDPPGSGPGEERVLGFAQAVGDGAFGGYLCMLLVAADARGRGIGRALIERTLVESGVLRLDLLSSDRAMSLYESFPHIRVPGFRLYPDKSAQPRQAD